MSFILPTNVRTFFGFDGQRAFARARTPRRETSVRFLMFDAFYCCMLLGLDQAKLGDEGRLEPTNFIDGYPEPYKGQAELIAGLLVDAEIRRLEIQPDDREDIERQMVHLLDLSSPSRLSGDGDQLLNRYAVSGFDRLKAAMTECDNLEDFLVGYHRIWTQS
jgi:hypothetical protein